MSQSVDHGHGFNPKNHNMRKHNYDLGTDKTNFNSVNKVTYKEFKNGSG